MIWRHLRQAPGLTLLAALTIGLGTGATTAVFAVVDPLLIKTLPVRDPDRLVLLHAQGTLQTIDSLPGPALAQFAAATDTVEAALATGGLSNFEAVIGGRHVTIKGSTVSANYFDVLGVGASLGRGLSSGGGPEGGPSVVLSHDAWTRYFDSNPDILAGSITIDERPYTIAGVAPRGFAGVMAGTSPDAFLPLESVAAGSWVHVVARLRPDVSRERALVALDPVFRRVAAATDIPAIEKEQAMSRLLVTPAGRGFSAARDALGSRPWMILVVVSLALLVSCANVAGLLLTRAASRRQQMSVELALGATRSRLAVRLLLEGTGIAVLGLAAGLIVAHVGSGVLADRLATGPAPITISPEFNLRLFGFAGGLLGLTVLICGVLPAVMGVRTDIVQGLRFRSSGLDRGARTSVLRRTLVVAQIAMSVTLLSTTGLLAHSFVNLQTFDLGFDARRVLAVTLRDRNTARPGGQTEALAVEIPRRVRETAGVAAVAFGSVPPLSGAEIGINIVREARPSAPPVHTLVIPAVAPEYFETLGLGIAQGTSCPNAATASGPSVVINQRLSRALFQSGDGVGERVRFVEGRRPPMTVVGVAQDSTYVTLREQPRNIVYLCWVKDQVRILYNITLFVRSVDPSAEPLAGVMRGVLASVDNDLIVHRAQTLEQYRSDSLRPDRLVAELAGGFTLITVLITAVGLYGVIAATVVRQTSEIGVRVALGADAGRVVRFVAVPALGVAVVGLALGIAGAAATSSVLSSLLFGLGHLDPVTWVSVTVALVLVCAVALALPVRRALRIDPVTALRAE